VSGGRDREGAGRRASGEREDEHGIQERECGGWNWKRGDGRLVWPSESSGRLVHGSRIRLIIHFMAQG